MTLRKIVDDLELQLFAALKNDVKRTHRAMLRALSWSSMLKKMNKMTSFPTRGPTFLLSFVEMSNDHCSCPCSVDACEPIFSFRM